MTREANLINAFGLGAAAGMRSMMPLAFVARELRGSRIGGAPASWLKGPNAVRLLTALAAAELVVDKLPVTPPRTSAPALAGRLSAGAIAAMAVTRKQGREAVLPALTGALGAALSACVMQAVRRRIAERSGVPDPLLALGEDALAAGLAWRCSAPDRT